MRARCEFAPIRISPRRSRLHCALVLAVNAALLCSADMTRAQSVTTSADLKLLGSHAALPSRSVDSRLGADALWYTIAPDDVLSLYVVDVPELSRSYRVSPGGEIKIPLLTKPIPTAGLTLEQLSREISERLRKAGMVSHPEVAVTVKSSRLHAVAITGAVQKPQLYPLFGPTTLLDVLSQAEGLSTDAGSTAIITRGGAIRGAADLVQGFDSASRGPQIIKVNVKKLFATGDPRLNVPIYPGDKVTVQRAGIVYVVGAVQRAGGFPLNGDHGTMTVLQAVALGEGLTSTALEKKSLIIRRGPQYPQGREAITVNLKKILENRAPDPLLKPDDILFIPDSASKKALHRGADAAIQIATGVVIWGHY